MRLLPVLVWMCWNACAAAQEPVRLGVYGTVESVTPLVVAGLNLAKPDGLPVLSPLGQTTIAAGDTLAVVATLADGALVATRMMAVYPVMGPLRAGPDGSMTVMGTSVLLQPAMTAAPGTWVAVSGLWQEGAVIATRLRRAEAGGYGHLTGEVDATAGQIGRSLLLGGRTPDGGFGSGIWMLTGIPSQDGLQVQLMVRGVFGGPVDLALWQGYASAPVASQTYMIEGTGVVGTARDAQMPEAGALLIRCARDDRIVKAAPAGLEPAFLALGCAKHTPAE